MIDKETLFSNVETVNSKQVAVLKHHFPQCFDKDGRFIQDKLIEIIQGQGVDVTTESYSLDWLGKSYARLLANLPPETLLTEDVAHNQKEQNKNSENLFIEGDNIEVLKHMVNSYSEKVKVIYIDPPYNTGSDGFVYQDDRKFTPEQLSKLAGIDLDEAERILSFTAKGSNSHSAWLTFMYPRLYVARELLSDDGVIFISIDDNEVAQLRLICDEVFGEENYATGFTIQSNPRGSQSNKFCASVHESILCYAKNINSLEGFLQDLHPEMIAEYNLKDAGGEYRLLGLRMRGGAWSREERPLLHFPIYVDPKTGKINLLRDDQYTEEVIPTQPSSGEDGTWRWSKGKITESIKLLVAKQVNRGGKLEWDIFQKDYLKTDGVSKGTKPKTIWAEKELNYQNGTEEIKMLFSSGVFAFPKPIALVKRLIGLVQSKEQYILDFFAGSATTAHAVMQLNAEDGGSRKFIMVQIPELIPKNKPAYKAGYKTVSEISKERIHRAAKKIQEEHPEYEGDLGFKLFNTIPDFRADADAELSLSNKTFFDDAVLSDEQYVALLTTWRVYDGSLLTSPVVDVSLDGYQAHLCDSRLYFIAPSFHSEALTTLLKQLDEDDTFAPNKIVLYGSNFDSGKQLEINDALKSYANKKSIELDLIVRY